MESEPLAPKLRFPEFSDAGGWVEEPFSHLYRFAPTNTFSRDQLNYTGGTVRNIHYGDIHTRFQAIFDIRREIVPFINPADLSNEPGLSTLCEHGDMIFADASEDVADVGKSIEIVELDGQQLVSGTHTILAKPNGSRLIVGFGGHLFCSPRTRVRIRRESQGSKVLGLSPGRLATIQVAFPPDGAEQQKIAGCLTSLDELIAAEGRKLEMLRAHKKGLMQDLFPREGETSPRLRFPEYREAEKWEQKRIVDLDPFVTSGSRGWAAYYAAQGSLFVRITNLSRKSIVLDLADTKFVDIPARSSEGVRTQLKEDDVLISITADVGMIGYVDASVPSPAYINQHIALVRFSISGVCSKFIAYFLASENSQRRFRAGTDTGTKAGMNLMEVQNLQLSLPPFPEQQRIADCLASLDALITAQAKKLDSLKLHKQGLMQGLFPSPEGGEW